MDQGQDGPAEGGGLQVFSHNEQSITTGAGKVNKPNNLALTGNK